MRKTIARLCAMALALLCFFSTTFAQNVTVTGTITDQNGAGVPGVTVTVRGTNIATQTDAQGRYSIAAPGNGVLVLSSVGYGTTEVNVNGQTTVNSTLTTQGANMNEVVVVGYGTARRRDVTGSVASVREKDFNKGVFTSPDQLIQGKAAGVLVINNTGQPGGSTTVRIRGASSIRSGNQPLFVVDGVPLSGGSARPGGSGAGAYGSDAGNPLNFINPNDIASMEILKDASATAIYGSRGANGVVIITTKRGQSGIPQIDVSASTSISTIAKRLEVLNADEYRQALKDYNTPIDSATGRLKGDFGSSENAMDAILRTGLTQNYTVAVGGGTENGRYRLSAGYLDQQGIIKTSELKKFTASLTSNFRFLESKKLGLDFNVLVTQTNERIAPVSAFVGFEGNLISQALQWNPTHKLRTDSGTIWIDPAVGATTINPLAQLEYFDDNARLNSIIASISPSYRITKELEYKFLYSLNRQVGIRRGQVNRLLNQQSIENRGAAFIGNQDQTNSQITNTLNYNKQITSDFNLNAVIGHEWLTYDTRGDFLSGQDFPNVGLSYYDFLGYSTQNSRGIGSFASPTTELQSFFGRAIINFKDRYLVTATYRADGSTRFGENNRYGYFPSLAFGWNVSNEDFLANNAYINTLKLRASWGKTGNQEFPSGASLNRFGFGQQSISQSNYGNEDLKWESSTTTNVGVDFSILDNRISGSVDYFYKKTTDVLFEQNIVQPAPGGKIWINLPGYILNKGVEIMLTGGIMLMVAINFL